MIRSITQNEDFLRNVKCRPVQPFEYKKVQGLARLMTRLIEDTGNGIGLSAPQIEDNRRYFVVFINEGKSPTLFINPSIVDKSEDLEFGMEGCLSFPGKFGKVERHKWIELKYLKGKKMVKSRFEGLDARVIQHELDHLDGITCIDKMIPLTDEEKAEIDQELLEE